MPRQCVRHCRLHPTESCRFGSACGRLPGMVADGVGRCSSGLAASSCRTRGTTRTAG
jgi:hypothetical protein